jgi:DNA-binding XRE family transcriptional regulator
MSGLTKKRPIDNKNDVIFMHHAGVEYHIPKKIAEKYRADNTDSMDAIDADEAFTKINNKYTKPGALLRGIRLRENLTQIEMAKKIKVTQSDISQMENGTRNIGRMIGKRIEKLFGVDYRSFLE